MAVSKVEMRKAEGSVKCGIDIYRGEIGKAFSTAVLSNMECCIGKGKKKYVSIHVQMCRFRTRSLHMLFFKERTKLFW